MGVSISQFVACYSDALVYRHLTRHDIDVNTVGGSCRDQSYPLLKINLSPLFFVPEMVEVIHYRSVEMPQRMSEGNSEESSATAHNPNSGTSHKQAR